MTVSVYEVGFDGDSARVVVEVSLLMVLMILFGTARVRLLKIHFQLFPVPRGRWECWHAEWLVHDTPVFRVHSSSCGAHCGVVHSPFLWLDHCCHGDCRDLALFVGRLPRCGGLCVAMSCGGGFIPGGAYDSVWDSVKPQTGKLFFIYFQYQEVVRCVCMLNGWFCNFDDICADNYNFSRFKLKDKCRSEQWEVICAVT